MRVSKLHGFGRKLRCSCSSARPHKRTYASYAELSPGYREALEAKSSTKKTVSPPKHKNNIAVVGGGITGLVGASKLAEIFPDAKIDLYDSSDELGGWVRTRSVNVGNGEVVFEQGPRTLRPHTTNGKVTLALIADLKLDKQIIVTEKTSAAAQNRFVYYPDRLVRMPGPGQGLSMITRLLEEPVFNGLISGAFGEYFRRPRPKDMEDESIYDFLSRRLDPRVANNIVSAVLHGVYAGDITQLSARTLMPGLWYDEVAAGSMAAGYLASTRAPPRILNRELAAWQGIDAEHRKTAFPQMTDASVYTFKKGLGTLTNRLVSLLRKQRNVNLRTNTQITGMRRNDKTGGLSVQSIDSRPEMPRVRTPPAEYSHVLSTVSARRLAAVSQVALPSLASQHSVTVMVVNLYFPNPDLLPVHGFGYLIPRSVSLAQNPERALGVVFDSDATVGQDMIEGTKVTVMLGGHWWDTFHAYPDEEEGAAMARSVLSRHLGITDAPGKVLVSLQRECIPQYAVGHDQRMEAAHEALLVGYRGRLQVAGNSYTGVGLNDCVAAGVNAAMTLADDIWRGEAREKPGAGPNPSSSSRVWTGLEDFEGFPEMKWWTPGKGARGERTYVPFRDMPPT